MQFVHIKPPQRYCVSVRSMSRPLLSRPHNALFSRHLWPMSCWSAANISTSSPTGRPKPMPSAAPSPRSARSYPFAQTHSRSHAGGNPVENSISSCRASSAEEIRSHALRRKREGRKVEHVPTTLTKCCGTKPLKTSCETSGGMTSATTHKKRGTVVHVRSN